MPVALKSILLTVLLICFNTAIIQANIVPDQERGRLSDYPLRPDVEVDYAGLELELEVGFEGKSIHGTATYRFRPKHAYVDKLVWAAPGMVISELTLNGGRVSYRLDGDSLVISFPEKPDLTREHTLSVSYSTTPEFGVHLRHNGTIFSSALPGSTAHWVPGPIHPWAAMPVVIRLQVPERLTGVATGAPELETSTDKGRLFVFRSAMEMPLTGLFFAVGQFEVQDSFSGTKNLRIYREKEASSTDRIQELLSFATRRVRDYERLMQSEIPLQAFHTVLLSDTMWETSPYYAGAVVTHDHDGQAETVIARALAAQWFGISLRPERWKDSGHITMLQAIAAEKLSEPDWKVTANPVEEVFVVPETVYQNKSMDQWQWMRHFLQKRSMPVYIFAVEELMRTLAVRNGVLTSFEFSSLVYGKTGRWIETPQITEPRPDVSLRYRVSVQEIRGSDRVSLGFEALDDLPDEEISARVYFLRDGRIHDRSVSFHGAGDQIEFSPEGFINNLWVEAEQENDVRFEMEKPFSFWLYQLRRDEDAGRREEAALALRGFATDPDLQLAVQDLLNREQDPKVLAAMHRLMAELTAGASGTERRFLEGIDSPHQQVRLESMKALGAYRGNTQVENQVFSVIQTSDDIRLVNEAIRTYRQLIPEEDFRDFAIRFLREDREEQQFTKTLIEELFTITADETAVNAVREYLDSDYPFDIRWLAFLQLRKHAPQTDWQVAFAREFSDDPDPRIRFATLFSISYMNLEDRGPFLHSLVLVEYDIRILEQASMLSTPD